MHHVNADKMYWGKNLQQICMDTGCCQEDLLGAMADWD